MSTIRRAFAAFTITAAVAVPSAVSAHHNTLPDDDGRIIGLCHAFSGGGFLGGPCVGGARPYIPAEEIGGANRVETGQLIWARTAAGGYTPGTVFVGRIEDGSALGVASAATENGAYVVLAGWGDDVDSAAIAKLLVLHDEERPALVFVGGDTAVSVSARVTVARALFYGAA